MAPTPRLVAFSLATLIAAIGLLIAWRKRRHPVVRLFVLARYSLLTAALQLGLGILALAEFPYLKSAMENIFVLDRPWHLCHVTWMSLLLATTCIVTYRTTKTSAPFRFADYRESMDAYYAYYRALGDRRRWWWHGMVHRLLDPQLDQRNVWRQRWIYLAILAFPIPLAALLLTNDDLPAARELVAMGEMSTASAAPSLVQLLWAMAAGIYVWFVIIIVATVVQQATVDQEVTDFGLFPLDALRLIPRHRFARLTPIVNFISRAICKLGPGFCRTDAEGKTHVLPGHGQLIVFAAIVVTAFVASLVFWSQPTEHAYIFPTLVSVLTILLMFVLLVSGAAFFFDYWRVPIVLVLVAASLVGWKLTGADSYYAVTRAPTPSQPFAGRLQPPPDAEGRRTLIIVTAAGGGIQASAWTSQVLTGLHERYGDDFTKSIGLISAVSGGSVGAMFYLDGLDPSVGRLGPTNNARLKEIRHAGRKSALEATAQAWAGWDMVKTFAPFLTPSHYDRGSAIEASWRMSLRHPEATMWDWREPLEAGHFPIVVFNATNVETGGRLVISNATFPERSTTPNFFARKLGVPRQTEFFTPGCEANLNVATAARLSATFPYVSPICRADNAVATQAHVADGGYVDNEGIFTALQWLGHLISLRDGERVAFDRVVILRIMPFPPSKEDNFPQLGWLYNVLGPLQAIMNVRTESQVARNNFDLGIVQQNLPAMMAQLELPPLEAHVIRIQFKRGDSQPPLSWKLSQRQQLNVAAAWRDLCAEASQPDAEPTHPIVQLDGWFKPSAKSAGAERPTPRTP